MDKMISALPIMVNNYAKLFGVSVRIQGTVAYTNGKTITLPRLDIKDPIKARLAYGYLAHESAHIRYTDFKILEKEEIKNNLLLFSLFNILEDNRIEKLISREYIGVFENLVLLNSYYETEWRHFCSTLGSISIFNVTLALIQCYSQCYCQRYLTSRKKSRLLYFHLKKRIGYQVVNALLSKIKLCSKSKNSHEVYECALEIYALLRHLDYQNEKNIANNTDKNDERLSIDNIERGQLRNSSKNSAEFLNEYCKFRRYSNDDVGQVTPSKNAAAIIQENSCSQSSSSRDDFGVITERVCQNGRIDYLRLLDNTYGIRNALHYRVKSYVDTLGNSTLRGTRIDPVKAQRIPFGEERIFMDRVLKKDFSTAVHILVDVSSSMLSTDGEQTTRCDEACRVALMLSLALEGIDGIKTMVTYFPGITSEYEIALRANEKASLMAPRFDQKPRGSTPLAQALWFAFDKLKEVSFKRNIVLVITDGMPDSVNNVKNCFDYAREEKIEIYGISIRSELIKNIFDNACVIENATMLEEKAFTLISSLFSLQNNEVKFSTAVME